MCKRLFSIIMVAGLLLTVTTVSPTDPNFRGGKANAVAFSGKITNIQGKVITITDAKGKTRVIETRSVEGLRVGDNAWCEEDCGRVKVPNKSVQVQRVIR